MADDDKPPSPSEVIVESLPATAGLVVGLGAAYVGIPPELAATMQLGAERASTLLLPGASRRWDRFTREFARPWENVADPEAEFWSRVKEREVAQEVWFVATSRLRDLVDPEAAAVLGALTQHYVMNDRLPDQYFRNACSLLVVVTSSELAELARLLSVMESLDVDTPRIRAEMHPSPAEQSHLRFHTLGEGVAMRTFTSLLGPRYDCNNSTSDVLRLLSSSGLAEGGTEASTGLVYIHIARAVVAQLIALLANTVRS